MRRAWLLPVALLVLLPALPGLLSGGALIPGDGFEIPLPGLAAAGRSLAGGELALWTGGLYGGAPMLTGGGEGHIYPPNLLLFAALPAGLAYTLGLALHLALSAWGAWAFAARAGRSPAARALTAMAWVGGGFVVGHLENLVRIEAIAWTPWAFAAAEALAQAAGSWRARLRPAAALAGAVGASMLTGYYPFAVYMAGWVAIYGGIRALQERGGALPWLAGGLGAGALLSAAQTVSTAAETLRAERVVTPEAGFSVDNSLAPGQLLELALPAFGGEGWDAQMVFYAGLAPLALALLSPRLPGRGRGQRRAGARERALAIVAAGGLLLALGEHLPGYSLLAQLPPLSLLGRPYRLFIGGAFALAALAGAGLDRLADEDDAGRRGAALGLAALAALAAVLTRLGDPIALGVSLLGAAGLAAAGLARRPAALPAALALVALELGLFQARLTGQLGPTDEATAALAPRRLTEPATAAFLGEALGPGERFLTWRPPDSADPDLLWMQAPLRFGLPAMHSEVTSLIPWWFTRTYGRGREIPVSADALALARVRYVLWADRSPWPDLPRAPRLGAVEISEVPDPAPRVFAVDRAEVLSREAIHDRLAEGPPLREAVLLEAPLAGGSGEGCGEVSQVEGGQRWLRLWYEGPPCYLVVTDSWHPGWSARFEGEDLEVARAYGVFRVVAAPGSGTLEMVWTPWEVWLGIGLSLLTGLGLVVASSAAGEARR